MKRKWIFLMLFLAAGSGVGIAQVVDPPLITKEEGPDLIAALDRLTAAVDRLYRPPSPPDTSAVYVTVAPDTNAIHVHLPPEEPQVVQVDITTDRDVLPALQAIAAALETHHLHWHRNDPTVGGECREAIQ